VRRALLVVALAAGAVLAPAQPAHADDLVGCVLYPHEPRRIIGGVHAHGENVCDNTLIRVQRLRVKLQEKKVLRFWPDEWHTKKVSRWTYWADDMFTRRHTLVECDTRGLREWRVWVDGELINNLGELRRGADFSEGRWYRCHKHGDVIL
jgi:hypothetical protein